jgi:hypothetical protein
VTSVEQVPKYVIPLIEERPEYYIICFLVIYDVCTACDIPVIRNK